MILIYLIFKQINFFSLNFFEWEFTFCAIIFIPSSSTCFYFAILKKYEKSKINAGLQLLNLNMVQFLQHAER